MSGQFGTNWLDLSSTSNRYIQTYYKGFVDISGGPLYVRNNNLFVQGGDISLNGRLYGAGDASLNGNVSMANDLTVGGNLYVKAYTTRQMITELSYQLIVAQDLSVNGRLFLSNDASINNRLFIGSDASLGGRLFVAGDVSLNGNVFVTTQASTDNSNKVATTAYVKTAVSALTGASAGFTGDVSINNRLYVGSDASLNSNLYVNGNFSVGAYVSPVPFVPNTGSAAGSTWTFSSISWTASASTTFAGAYAAYKAFTTVISDANKWASGNSALYSAGAYVGTTTTSVSGLSAQAGEWLQLQSSVPIVISSYSLVCPSVTNRSPQTFIIIGSNDGTTWYPIQNGSYSSNPFTVRVATPYYTITTSGTATQNTYLSATGYATSSNAYTYFRFITLSTFGEYFVEIGQWFINFTYPNATNKIFFANDTSINGNLVIAKQAIVQNDASINNRLYVGSDASLQGNLYVGLRTINNSDISANARLYVGSDSSFGGNLYVTGTVATPTFLTGNIGISSLVAAQFAKGSFTNATTQPAGTGLMKFSGTGQYGVIVSGGVYFTNNYGVTWTTVTSGAGIQSAQYGYYDCALSYSGQYGIVNPWGTTLAGTIYVTNNYGVSWATVRISSYTAFNTNSVALSYSGQYAILGGYGSGMWYSSDYGQTWLRSNITGGYYAGGSGITDTGYAICSGQVSGIYYSTNYGQTWTVSNLSSSQYSLGIAWSNGLLCIAGSSGNGIYYSSNGGQTWTASNITGGNFSQVSMSLTGQFCLACSSSSSGVYYSTNYGQTWTQTSLTTSSYNGMVTANGAYNFVLTSNTVSYQTNSSAYINKSPLVSMNDVSVNGNIVISGSTNIGSGLYVTNDASLQGKLYVGGNATVNSINTSGVISFNTTLTSPTFIPDASQSVIPAAVSGLAAPYSQSWTSAGTTWTVSSSVINGTTLGQAVVPGTGYINAYYPAAAFVTYATNTGQSSGGVRSWGYLGYHSGTLTNGYYPFNGAVSAYTTTSGVTGGIGTLYGNWIQLQSSTATSITSFAMAPERAQSSAYRMEGPGAFYILGTNDGTFSTWDPILYGLFPTTQVNNNNTNAYYTLFTSAAGTTSNVTDIFPIPYGTASGVVNGSLTYTTYGNAKNSYSYFRLVVTGAQGSGGAFFNLYYTFASSSASNAQILLNSASANVVDVSGKLQVTNGLNIINSDASLNGNVYVGKDLTVNGNFYVQAYTTKQMITELSYQLIIAEDISVNGRLFLSNDASINNRLFVGSDVSMGGKLFTVGDTSHNARLFVGSDASFGTRVFVAGDLSVNGNVNVNGNLTAVTQTSTDNSTKVATTAYVKSVVGGISNTYFATDVSMAARLYVTSDVSFNGNAYIGKNLILGVSGQYSPFNLDVSGSVNFSGALQGVLTLPDGSHMISNNEALDFSNNFCTTLGPQITVSANTLGAIMMSATGQYQTATTTTAGIHTSSNFGVTWTLNASAPTTGWGTMGSCAMSANGQYQYALSKGSGYIYFSSDYGATWAQFSTPPIAGAQYYGLIAVSANNKFITVVVGNSSSATTTWTYITTPAVSNFTIYNSQNSGATWTSTNNANSTCSAYSLAMSANGQYQTITAQNYYLYTSKNYGITWTYTNNTGQFLVSMSATGQYIYYTAGNGGPAISNNYGQSFTNCTWTGVTGYTGSDFVLVSSTGQYVIIIYGNGYFFTSVNYGQNWKNLGYGYLAGAAMSANGKYVTLIWGGIVYTMTVPNLNNFQTMGKFISAGDASIGSRLFITSDASFGGKLFTVGDTSHNAKLFVGSDASFGTRIFVAGDLSVNGNVNVNGSLTAVTQTSTDNSTKVATTAYVKTVVGGISNTYFSTDVSMASRLYVANDLSLNGRLFLGYSISGSPFSVDISGQTNFRGLMNPLSLVDGSVLTTSMPALDLSTNFAMNWSKVASLSTTRSWYMISLSATGQYQSACDNAGFIYISNNYGVTWTQTATSQGWRAISISSSGQYQTAVNYGYIYTSSNYGLTWTQLSYNYSFAGVSVSATGQYQNACVYNGAIWTSSNYGQTWTSNTSAPTTYYWGSISMSATGQYQLAGNSSIYVSKDYGVTWTGVQGTTGSFSGNAVSATGQYQTFAASNNYIWISSNYGQTWTSVTSPFTNYCLSVSISANGQFQVACGNGPLYFSNNYGVSWSALSAFNQNFSSISISANAQYITSVVNGGFVYSSITPYVNLAISNGSMFGGDISANSRLYVRSDVSLGSRLFVTSDTSMNGNASVGSDLTVGGNLYVKAYTTKQMITELSYQLIVAQDLSVNGRLFLSNDASVNGRLFIGSDASFGGSLNIAGNGKFYMNNFITPILNPSTFGTSTTTSLTYPVGGQSIATSYTGQYVLTCNPQGSSGLGLSTNYGASFSTISTGQSFSANVLFCCTMSSDGSKMAITTGATIYYSTNYGVSWTTGATLSAKFLSATSDFTRLYAYGTGGVYLSTNYGSSFTLQSSSIGYDGLNGGNNGGANNSKFQMNASTGQYGLAYSSTAVYYTSNYGVTWSASSGISGFSNQGTTVGVSNTGQYCIVDVWSQGGGNGNKACYYSSNYGSSFSAPATITGTFATNTYGGWRYSPTISSSGKYIIVGSSLSTDYGVSFQNNPQIVALYNGGGEFLLNCIISGNELINYYVMWGTGLLYSQQNPTLNTYSQSLSITTDISTNSRLFISNDTSMNSKLYVLGDVSMSSNLYVAGQTINRGDISANSRLYLGSDASFGSRLFVAGDLSLNGNVSMASDLTVGGNLYVKAYTTRQMITELSYQLIVAQDLSVNGRLFLSNDASINNRLFVGADVSFGGKLFTIGDTSHNAKLFVGSDASFGTRVFIAGDLSVNGNVFATTQTSTDNSTKVATTAYVKTALSTFTPTVKQSAIFNMSKDAPNSKKSMIIPASTSIVPANIATSVNGNVWGVETYTYGLSVPPLSVVVGSSTGVGQSTIGYSTQAPHSNYQYWSGLGYNIFSTAGNGVEWDGSKWVAVGEGTNTIATSSDALIWSSVAKPTAALGSTGRGIAYSSVTGRIVAVCDGTTNTIVTSANGSSWTGLGATIFSTAGSGVDTSGTMWVAVGSGTNTVAYSYDGVSWVGLGTTVFSTSGNAIKWNGSYWLASGSGTNNLAKSTDGINWTFIVAPITFTNIAWNGTGTFVATSGTYAGGTTVNTPGTYRSTDGGNTWTNTNSGIGVNVAWGGTGGYWIMVGAYSTYKSTNDGVSWTTIRGYQFEKFAVAVAWNASASMWVMNSSNKFGGSPAIYTSTDEGTTWVASSNSGSFFTNISTQSIWTGTKWFATGNSPAYIMTSTDGSTWAAAESIIFSTRGNSIKYNGASWVAVGEGTNTIATSTDGLSWTGRGTSIFSTAGRGVAWNGLMWVAVGAGTNTIATSYDGITWTGRGTTIFSTSGYSVAWNGYLWVAGGDGATNTIATSYDGITWTGRARTVFTTICRSLAWNGSLWVAGGSGTNTIGTSIDGITWTARGSPVFTTSCNCVTWNGNNWLGCGTNAIGTSTDGINWNSAGTIFSTSANSVATNIIRPYKLNIYQSWVAVTNSAFSYNYNEWIPFVFSGTAPGVYVAYNGSTKYLLGGGSTYLTTDYFRTFTAKTAIVGTTSFMTYINNLWVATGLFTSPSAGKLLTSADDGTTWALVSGTNLETIFNGATATITCIIKVGTRYVAGGSGTIDNYIAYSDDNMVTWTSAVPFGSAIINNINDIENNGTIYVAAGATSIATSSDGITWTSRVVSADVNFSNFVHLLYESTISKWICLGVSSASGPSIIYSSNGINWSKAVNTEGFSFSFGSGKPFWSTYNSMFIAGGLYSKDGITWYRRAGNSLSLPGTNPLRTDISGSNIMEITSNLTLTQTSTTFTTPAGSNSMIDIVAGPYYQRGYDVASITI